MNKKLSKEDPIYTLKSTLLQLSLDRLSQFLFLPPRRLSINWGRMEGGLFMGIGNS